MYIFSMTNIFMANFNINYALCIVFCLFISTQITSVSASKNIDEENELVLDNMCLKTEKVAKIIFYAEDVASGPNAVLYEVARATVSTDALLSFGKVFVIGGPITAAPGGGDSEVVGKLQGMMTSADKETTALAVNVNVVFTSGKYNGSTLAVAGRSLVQERRRSLAVVGGTGVFRFTRGYAVVNTISSRVGEDSLVYTLQQYSISATFCPLI